MNDFMPMHPDPRIAYRIQQAMLYILSWNMHISGIAGGVQWKITPVTDGVTSIDPETAQVSLLDRGVWKHCGTFVLHETTMEGMVEFMEIEILKIVRRKE